MPREFDPKKPTTMMTTADVERLQEAIGTLDMPVAARLLAFDTLYPAPGDVLVPEEMWARWVDAAKKEIGR